MPLFNVLNIKNVSPIVLSLYGIESNEFNKYLSPFVGLGREIKLKILAKKFGSNILIVLPSEMLLSSNLTELRVKFKSELI